LQDFRDGVKCSDDIRHDGAGDTIVASARKVVLPSDKITIEYAPDVEKFGCIRLMLNYSGVPHEAKKVSGNLEKLMTRPNYAYGLPVVTLNGKRFGNKQASFKNIGMRLNYYDTKGNANEVHQQEMMLEEFNSTK
jgi:hypothetical protein